MAGATPGRPPPPRCGGRGAGMRPRDAGGPPRARGLASEDLLAAARSRGVALRPPLQRRGTVRRPKLLARLDGAPAASLILLVAPGGYGKTTLLSQWIAQSAAVCAWVTADRDDTDPSFLARHIAVALQVALPLDAPAVGLSADVVGSPRLDPARLLAAVVALRRLDRSVVLVLDDLHEIASRASFALVRALLDAGGSALRVVAAGRVRPDPVLADLVATGRCVELGPADLAFSEAETRQVFVALRQPVTPDAARTVMQRTEGWPAGAYLAALAVRRGPRGAPAAVRPEVISGDDVYIADYFRDEVLSGQPSEDLTFLLRTAVLDGLSGPLCDAVLQTAGSGARLKEAARRNLFVVPVGRVDREGPWY